MSASAAATSPGPKLPLSLHWSSVLSQDMVTSASVLVDSTSPAAVAAFTHPTSGEAEALAVVNKQICHVMRDRQTDSGWRAVPLFGGQAAGEVAAGVAYQGTASQATHGLFTDAGKLHATRLAADGKTWSAPAPVDGGLMSGLRVAYAPDGRVVVYGANDKGDLVTAYQTAVDGPFTATTCSVKGALAGGDFQLCMTDEASFTILVNINAAPWLITGTLGSAASTSGPFPALKFTGKLKHVALGYWSDAQNALIFLLVDDDDALHSWSQSGTNDDPVTQPIPNSAIAHATGHVSTDGSLHVYAVDKELGLWVLHQSARKPWRDDGTPNWAPILPLDKGIGRVVSDMNPAAAPSLFAVDGGDFSLRLHAQDAGSRMWKSQKILRHAPQAYDVTRHRAEVRILDANAMPLRNQAVTVKAEKGASAVEVSAGGRLHLVDEKGTTINTDIYGKLTVAIMATEHGLACPNLVVSCDGLPEPVTVKPAGGLHEYLSGRGTLNPTNPPNRGSGGPLPQFDQDGATLKAATVNGALLAPGATSAGDPGTAANVASAIRNGALVALKNPPAGVHGFGGSLVEGKTSFQVFDTRAALEAHSRGAGLAREQLGDFWDDVKHFFADIFEGIKNFVIKIVHFVVDVVESVVEFTLDIAKFAGQVLHLDISGIEKASALVHGFFNSVQAGIDKVVKWLEALFDFGAIWRSKMAIQGAVESFAPYVIKMCGEAEKLTDGWFAKQKTTVNTAFDAAIKKYAGQSYGQTVKWQSPTAPPSTTPTAGQAAPSDFTANPHHNWLHDKVTSYQPETPDLQQHEKLIDLWNTVEGHLKDSGKEFQAALAKFKDAMWVIITDPASFATKAIPDFLDMVRDLVLAVLDLLDAIIDALISLVATGADAADALLKAELPLGFLNTLWGWMADAAGYPNDAKLNLYALGSLLIALPATLVYKLIVGVDHEPFPEGKIPTLLAGSSAGSLRAPPWQCVLTSDIARIIQFIPGDASNFLASDCPGWLTGVNIVFDTAVFFLRHGLLDRWQDELLGALALSGFAIARYTKVATYLVGKWKDLGKDGQNDFVAVVTTLYGAGALGYAIYRDVTTPPADDLQDVAIILMPLSPLFAWLTLSALRNNEEIAPFAIAGNVAFDFVSYVDGGFLLMLDTIQHRNKAAIAAP